MRTAIVSTYPPRVCGIGTFAADVHAGLLGVAGLDGVERVVIVDEQTRPRAGRCDRDDRAGRPGRLRAGCAAPRPAGRRRGTAPARIRHLRRPRRRLRAVPRRGAVAAARRHPAHGAGGAGTPPGGRARVPLRQGGARDRDDGVRRDAARGGSEPARRRRSGSCRTARRRCLLRRAAENRNGRRSRYAAGRPRRPPRRALPAVDVRADLGRQGDRDGDRRAAVDRRAPSAGALPGRRSDPPRRRTPRG